MYPNSTIHVLAGVPLDKDYNHTFYIDSNTDFMSQFNTFYNYRKYTYDKVQYQRVNKNTIRIQEHPERLYDCNYLLFRNAGTVDNSGAHNDYANSAKWFYAFIDEVNYINENCCEIVYTIDVMQTWYFDYELGYCFVEREHTLTDNFGENTVPESIETNTLICNTILNSYSFNPHRVIFHLSHNYRFSYQANNYFYRSAATPSPTSPFEEYTYKSYGDYIGQVINDVDAFDDPVSVEFSAIEFSINDERAFPNKTWHGYYGLLKFLSVVDGNDVIDMVMTYGSSGHDYTVTTTKNLTNSALNGYIPKNKKLYTYPYNKIVITNNNGQINELRFELFNTPTSQTWRIIAESVEKPFVYFYPENYCGVQKNYDEGIILNNYPSPLWSSSALNAWNGEKRTAAMLGIIASAVGGLTGAGIAAVGGKALSAAVAGGMASSLISNVGTTIAEKQRYSDAPGIHNNLSTDGAISCFAQKFVIYVKQMCVRKEYAQIIDNYFSMFGYAINRVKKPNVRDKARSSLRPEWNYVKTQGCIIHGQSSSHSLPADVESKIAKIYDNGITFWMPHKLNPNSNVATYYVGDYNRDNSPR